MRRSLVVFALAVSGAAWLFAQDDEWNRLVEKGMAAERAGNFDEALKLLQQAVRVAESSPTPTMRLATTFNNMAVVYGGLGQPAQAMRQYRRSLTVIERLQGKNSYEYAIVLVNMGVDHLEEREFEPAEKLIREALAIYEALPDVPNNRIALARNALGEVLLKTGRHNQAEPLLNQALAFFRADPTHKGKLGITLNNLASVRRLQGRHDEAIEIMRESLALLESDLGPDNPHLVRPLNNLGIMSFDAGHRTEAHAYFARALSIAEAKLGAEHPLYASVLLNYSDLVKASGDKSRAKNMAARAKEVLARYGAVNGRGMTVDAASFR